MVGDVHRDAEIRDGGLRIQLDRVFRDHFLGNCECCEDFKTEFDAAYQYHTTIKWLVSFIYELHGVLS